MQNSEIAELASRLEEAADEGGTFVHMDADRLASNREGFLRCAALFLRAAIAPYSKEDSFIVDVDPKQMISDDTDVFFSRFERREEFDAEPIRSQKQWSGCFLEATIYILVLVCLVVGAGTLVLGLIRAVKAAFS